MTEEQLDSMAHAEAMADSLAQVADSAQNDPHKREYYMAQIPFTEEQLEASNAIIMDGLYNSGIIFKDKLDNLALSEKALRRITDNYPAYENMADVYYHLFLLYSRKDLPEVAETYVGRLKKDYPDNEWTTLLTDPYYAENARFGEHIEDSIYAATYDAFKADRYGEVAGNVRISESRFPLGANRDKFIFIGGLGKLNNGDADGCLADMKTVVEKYPQSGLSAMAGMIVNGVTAGRRLRGGKFDIGNVWERRSEVLSISDSTAQKELSAERNTDFVFMIAYRPDSVNENQLLYELAKYNFTSYMVRNFDISIEDVDGLHRMTVSGFRNYDEALQYARQLHTKRDITRNKENSRTIIISTQNLPLLGTQFSYDDYDKFYNKHFAPLKVSTLQLLAEPEEITTTPDSRHEPTEEDADRLLDNSTIIDNGLDTAPDDNGTTVIPETPETQKGNGETQGNDGEVVIPTTPSLDMDNGDEEGATIVTEEDGQAKNDNKTVVPEKTTPEENSNGIIVPLEERKNDKAEPKKQPVQPAQGTENTENVKDKQQPQKEEKKKEKEQPKPSKEIEDEFYFDEDTAAPDKKKDDKKVEEGLEDEYYDLEGF